MRPKSIVQFELVYAGVIALGLVSVVLGWNDMVAAVGVQRMIAQFGMGMIYGPVILGILLQMLFWYFIARRGSSVARWIFVILTALGLAWSALGLAVEGEATVLKAVVEVALLVMQVIAIVLVFRPDTADWFGDAPAETA